MHNEFLPQYNVKGHISDLLKIARTIGDENAATELLNDYYNGDIKALFEKYNSEPIRVWGVELKQKKMQYIQGLSFDDLLEAAEQGDDEAQCQVAYCYRQGKGVKKDETLAITWFEKAAEQGNTVALYEDGKLCYECYVWEKNPTALSDRGNWEGLAFTQLLKAANQGSIDAKVLLANSYLLGLGTDSNVDKGFKQLLQLAEDSNSRAQYYIGCYYRDGRYVEEDDSLAESWFLKACGDKNHYAAYALAKLYDRVRENDLEAKKWYLNAAHWGSRDSATHLGLKYTYGNNCFPKNYESAFFWRQKAADLGSIFCLYQTGIFLLLGIGVEQNLNEAFCRFQQASENWDGESPYYMMAACRLMGLGIKQDTDLALSDVEKGLSFTDEEHEKSLKPEQYELFIRYILAKEYLRYSGYSAETEHHKKGFELLEYSAKEGLALAQYEVGEYFWFGRVPCEKDYAKAYYWYQQAAKQGYEDAIDDCQRIENDYPEVLKEVTDTIKPVTTESSVDAVTSLNSLIGLANVKTRVQALVNEIKLKNERSRRGLPVGQARSYHMIFTGNPGTGKTVVARIIAEVFYELGITKENKIIETDRSGLVGEYIGHTAVKTTEIINSAKGGVLFIDEAYALKGDGNDFGKEAIETLLKKMEDERENLIVIAAGYTNDMKELLDSNAGLASRFTRTIHFDDYSTSELLQIFDKIATDNGYFVDASSYDMISDSLQRVKAKKAENFGNAREVRNLFEHSIQEQENRICNSEVDIASMCNDELQTLIPEDFSIFC